MLSFATEFPVASERTTSDFLRAMMTWISGSPHTGLSAEMLRELPQKEEVHVENGNEKVQSLVASSPDVDLAGIRYSRHDDDLEWLTTVVFSRTSSDAWVGIRVECESQHAAARLPSAKKPVVVRTVLESLGGAADGPLSISNKAHFLTNTDIELAAKLIRGDAGCRLPIVYVSARFQGGYILDVDRLAAELSGMAHVVVEPNRPFSVRLQLEVDSENVYGGTIGIYCRGWRASSLLPGRRLFDTGSSGARHQRRSPGCVTESTSDRPVHLGLRPRDRVPTGHPVAQGLGFQGDRRLRQDIRPRDRGQEPAPRRCRKGDPTPTQRTPGA